jgi:hypothetical protein
LAHDGRSRGHDPAIDEDGRRGNEALGSRFCGWHVDGADLVRLRQAVPPLVPGVEERIAGEQRASVIARSVLDAPRALA